MEVVFGAMMISIGKTTFMRAACRREAAVERVIVLAAVGLVRYAGFPCGLIFGGQRRLLCPSVGFRRVPLNANASRPTPLRLHVGVFGVIKRVRRRGSVNAAATTIAPIALRGLRPRNPNDLHS